MFGDGFSVSVVGVGDRLIDGYPQGVEFGAIWDWMLVKL